MKKIPLPFASALSLLLPIDLTCMFHPRSCGTRPQCKCQQQLLLGQICLRGSGGVWARLAGPTLLWFRIHAVEKLTPALCKMSYLAAILKEKQFSWIAHPLRKWTVKETRWKRKEGRREGKKEGRKQSRNNTRSPWTLEDILTQTSGCHLENDGCATVRLFCQMQLHSCSPGKLSLCLTNFASWF